MTELETTILGVVIIWTLVAGFYGYYVQLLQNKPLTNIQTWAALLCPLGLAICFVYLLLFGLWMIVAGIFYLIECISSGGK